MLLNEEEHYKVQKEINQEQSITGDEVNSCY